MFKPTNFLYLSCFLVGSILLLFFLSSSTPNKPAVSEKPANLVLKKGRCIFGFEYEGSCLCQHGYTGEFCDQDVYVSYPTVVHNESVLDDPECRKFYGQFGQDEMFFINFWKGRKPGVFLDLGANQPKDHSNTYFLEKCLGWKGLCIEANPQWAEKLKAERSCIVENVCISDAAKTLAFIRGPVLISPAPPGTVVDGKNVIEIPCLPLIDVLERNDFNHFDYVSLDIDNFQTEIMRSFFSNPKHHKYEMSTMVVETYWSDVPFYQMLSDNGYFLASDSGGFDHVFMKSRITLRPPTYQQHIRGAAYSGLVGRQRNAGDCIQGGSKNTEWWNALNC